MAEISTKPGCATVASVAAAYPDDPQITVPESCAAIVVVNLSSTAADVVTVSFDGTHDAAVLVPGVYQSHRFARHAGRRIWMKAVNAPDVLVAVE